MASNARDWWSQRRQQIGKSDCGTCRTHFMIPSPKEVALATVDTVLHHEREHSNNTEEEIRLARARECTDAGVKAGLEAAVYACVAAAIPTVSAGGKIEASIFSNLAFILLLQIHANHSPMRDCKNFFHHYLRYATRKAKITATRMIPWAKASLNYTAQALIISSATVATYFIVTEKTILACSREASYARLEKERASAGSS